MKLHLRVVSGLQVGDQARFEPPGGTIGRGDGCALHLRDESVSRSHLELRYLQDGWWAFPQSTRSPSLVDGVPAGSSPLALRRRGTLQIGAVALEYTDEADAPSADLPDSPPTMINVRRQLPTIQHAVLPQMTPIRAAEPASDAPATLILRRQPAEPVAAAPPTMIRRPTAPSPVSPPPPPDTPEPIVQLIDSGALAEVEKERDQLRSERDQLRSERDRLAAELRQAAHERESLRSAAQSAPHAGGATSGLATQALKLLDPFVESLEQATCALQEGDAAQARTLLRDASFGLADLRDLFESAKT